MLAKAARMNERKTSDNSKAIWKLLRLIYKLLVFRWSRQLETSKKINAETERLLRQRITKLEDEKEANANRFIYQ